MHFFQAPHKLVVTTKLYNPYLHRPAGVGERVKRLTNTTQQIRQQPRALEQLTFQLTFLPGVCGCGRQAGQVLRRPRRVTHRGLWRHCPQVSGYSRVRLGEVPRPARQPVQGPAVTRPVQPSAGPHSVERHRGGPAAGGPAPAQVWGEDPKHPKTRSPAHLARR